MPSSAPESCYLPVAYDDATIYAVRAWRDGNADAGQQKIAFDWVVRALCRYPDQAFRLGGEDGRRATDFMEGRQFVGRSILKLLEPEVTPKPKSQTEDTEK